jgi:hypothetical protein
VAFADDFRGVLRLFLSRDFRSPANLTEAAKRRDVIGISRGSRSTCAAASSGLSCIIAV